ncbi:MAG: nucleoside triphosphate pyrophosphohydrolase [Thermodesulfovibrionales bacterium]
MDFQEFVKIMEALRRECPWDREQTRESLKPYIIEEAYELVEAIDEGDPAKVKEELGDLLLQIVFQSRIAEERGEFSVGDVVEAIGSKMVSRHPHVFDKAHFATAEEVARQWEERKKEEGKLRESILEGVPESMPSLLRAHRLQSRASKAGFDWRKVEDVMEKLEEELAEFREALRDRDKGRIEDELGDIFFALVNVSRFVGVNPEDALRKTISKFISRFRHIEARAAEAGLSLPDMTLEEMDRFWEEAKERARER